MVIESSMINLLCRIISSPGNVGEFLDELSTLHLEDWSVLIQLATKHGVDTQIYKVISQNQFSDRIPLECYNRLRAATIGNVSRNMLFLHEAGMLLRAYKENGISAIGLKGIYLLDNIYEDISLRKLSDLDIMVRKKDILEAIELAKGLGYRPTTYFDSLDKNSDIKHVPPLKKENGPYLEIHWSILAEDEPFLIDIEGLWNRAVQCSIGGADCYALSPEDLLMHLCLHLGYQHHFNVGLRGLVDIRRVLFLKKIQIDWNGFLRIARDWTTDRVAWLTLSLANTLINANVPEAILNQLAPKDNEPWQLSQARAQILYQEIFNHPMTPDLAGLASERNIIRRIRLIFRRIFLPKQTMARIYDVSPNDVRILLYYFYRFKDLYHNYSRTVKGILAKDERIIEDVSAETKIEALKKWMR